LLGVKDQKELLDRKPRSGAMMVLLLVSLRGNEKVTWLNQNDMLNAEAPVSGMNEELSETLVNRPLQNQTREGVEITLLD